MAQRKKRAKRNALRKNRKGELKRLIAEHKRDMRSGSTIMQNFNSGSKDIYDRKRRASGSGYSKK